MGWQGLKLEMVTRPSSYYCSRILGLVNVHVCGVGGGTQDITRARQVLYSKSWCF